MFKDYPNPTTHQGLTEILVCVVLNIGGIVRYTQSIPRTCAYFHPRFTHCWTLHLDFTS